MPTSTKQVASMLSLLLFSWLDPLIWKGYFMAHIGFDELPALADYDHAKNLVQRASKVCNILIRRFPTFFNHVLLRQYLGDLKPGTRPKLGLLVLRLFRESIFGRATCPFKLCYQVLNLA
jgi:hypothetical protein